MLHQKRPATLPETFGYVYVTVNPAGNVTLPNYTLHENGTDEVLTLPDYSYLLIENKRLGKKAFFDLRVAKVPLMAQLMSIV